MTESTGNLRSLKYYTLFAFYVIGVITVLLGQVLPILSSRLGLNDAQSGGFFLAQFAGSITGTVCAASLARRYGFVRTTIAGFALMLIGLPGLNFHDYYLCWLSIFVYGSGLGITIPSVNLLTIEITPLEKQSSSVNLVNFMWGLGAISSRPFVAAVSINESLVNVVAILLLLLMSLVVLFASAARSTAVARAETVADERDAPTIWYKPLAWLFALFGFFVIGIESGLGGWLTTYSKKIDVSLVGLNPTDLFFSFLVLGRGLASIVSRYLSENTLISICAVILLTGISLIVFGSDIAVLGAAVAGLGTSAIFPTNMVRFTKVFGASAIKRATPLFVAGILGAAALSSLTGVISTAYGSLNVGLSIFVGAAAMVLCLQVSIAASVRRLTKLRKTNA